MITHNRPQMLATLLSHAATLTIDGPDSPYLWTSPEARARAIPHLVAFARELVDAAIASETPMRPCKYCQTLMPIGRPHGFSRNRMFCSDACKLRDFRGRRRAEAAQ